MKRKIVITFTLLAVAAGVWAGWEAWIRRGVRGVYLVDGGLDYVEIAGSFWRPDFRPHEWIPDRNLNPRSVSPGQTILCRIGFQSGRPKVFYQQDAKTLGEWNCAPIEDGYRLLRRGAKGSWDLVEYKEPRIQMLESHPIIGTPFAVCIPSYLHRVEDRELLEYFKSQREERNPEKALQVAEGLLARHADDPYVRTLYLGALLRQRDDATFRRRLEEWRAGFESAPDPYLQRIPRLADYAMHGREAERWGTDAYGEVIGFYNDLPALDILERRLLEWRQPAELYYPPDEIFRTEAATGPYNNFLKFQVGCKCARVMSTMRLFSGKWGESLTMLTAVLDQSRLLNQRSGPIDSLIGTALMAISARGLELYALNCILVPGDERELLERIGRQPEAHVEASVEARELFENPLKTMSFQLGRERSETTVECDTRSRTSYAMLEAVRVAAAVRARQARTGKLPKEIESLAPEFLTDLPRDPHLPGQTIHYRYASPDEAFVYSVGTDKSDDRAALAYDPTNGAISSGDVFIRIPREREFPFAREGTKAADQADLLRQFPNGLPADVFAATRGRGLNVWQDETGVAIYSYGPDADERDIDPPHEMEETYDPTNGTTSNGDLWVRLRR